MNTTISDTSAGPVASPAPARRVGMTSSAETIAAGRRRRSRRRILVTVALAILTIGSCALALMVGGTFYTPGEVWRVIVGENIPGASFTVGELRLPRMTLGALAGFCFGMAGITFQGLLRNPLAAPDVIGISAGASAAAVTAIVIFSLGPTAVSVAALGGALVTAAVIYALAHRGGFAGARLILIGIGIAAMLNSVITYVLSRAAAWDLQTAMRWITGSLGGASWSSVTPVALAAVVLIPLLAAQSRGLGTLQLGDDSAASLGVSVSRTRILALLAATALLAFATAAAGPIAFVAFMSGPIAVRLTGPAPSYLLSSALVGSALVVLSDVGAQFLFETRYPVGVVTGALGAPFLLVLLTRFTRTGGSL